MGSRGGLADKLDAAHYPLEAMRQIMGVKGTYRFSGQ